MNKLFTDDAWEDYLSWANDKSKLRRINELIKDTERHPFSGLGKPEGLRYNLAGKWSRRIDSEHRMIYRVEGDTLFFYSFRDHY